MLNTEKRCPKTQKIKTALEKQHFDLEFFMKSTDAAMSPRRYFHTRTHPVDLENLWEIGKKKKTFEEFLKKEKKFLWGRKLNELALKILKRQTAAFVQPLHWWRFDEDPPSDVLLHH